MAKTQILDYYIHLTDAALASICVAKVEAGNFTDPSLDLITLPLGGFGIFLNPYASDGTVDSPGGLGGVAGGDGAANIFAGLVGDASALPIVEVGETPPATGGYIT